MKYIYLFFMDFYRFFVSPILKMIFGSGCRYIPTCSEYSKMAVEKHGLRRGIMKTFKRMSTCHPFSIKSLYDPL